MTTTSATDASSATTKSWPAGEVGDVTVSPSGEVVVGEYSSSTFRYTTGPYGVDDGGGLIFLFPLPADRGRPQFSDPLAPDYCTVTNSGKATVTPRFHSKLYQRPWSAGVAVDVTDGPLAPGDVVEFKLGDRDQGSPGARAQSFVEAASRVRVMVDPFATGVFYDVPGQVEQPVAPGQTEALVAVVDSESAPGEQVRLTVRAIDRYGNVATSYAGRLEVRCEDAEITNVEMSADDKGIRSVHLPAPAAGTRRFEIRDRENGLSTFSNPIIVSTLTDQATRLVWGDTQGQTGESVGTGTLESFLDYARDAARLDFVTHSANDFQVESSFYEEVWDAVDKHTIDGEFIAFGGFEWSGNTPTGGDHNVLYADRTAAPLMRSSHALIQDLSDLDTDRRTITELNETMRDQDINGICVAHVGGRVADLTLVEPDTTPALEIVSVHGWFEWLGLEALQQGLEVGFVGASDDHSGRPGASYPSQPSFGVRSGLAAVRTAELTRVGILNALRARHCYATTGERIHLDVSSGAYTMGDKWRAMEPPVIDVSVAGTSGIEAIDLMGPDGALQTWRPPSALSRRRLRISWRGARHRYRGRTLVWDGYLTVSGAAITNAKTWAFDHPDQGITAKTDNRIDWISSTNGDSDGIELELDGDPETIRFVGGGVDLDLDLNQVSESEEGLEINLPDGLDKAINAMWLPETPPPHDVQVTFTPTELVEGTNAYFVRVRQADGHRAWSSPMFVESDGSAGAIESTTA